MYQVIDTEATTFEKGHPYSEPNRLCVFGIGANDDFVSYPIEHSLDYPYGPNLRLVQERLSRSKMVVGLNIKYDFGWSWCYDLVLDDNILVWDCAVAEYISSGQLHTYPSMNDLCDKYGIPQKEDLVSKYWDAGINTPDIPLGEVQEYNINDLKRTEQIFKCQLGDIPKELHKLILNSSKDSLVTSEMEFNGIKYDVETSIKEGGEILRRIEALDQILCGIINFQHINWNSGDHISAVLYGGVVKYSIRESFTFVYKDQKKSPVEKQRWKECLQEFPRLVEPLPRTELKKVGFFSTDVKTLAKLKAKGTTKEIINLLLERSVLEKEVSTYFHGIPKLIEEMRWSTNIIHPNFNHCVTRTSRLSGSRPNPQNIPESVRKCLISRY